MPLPSLKAFASAAQRRARRALSSMGGMVARRVPEEWAAEKLLIRMRRDPTWLPPGNIEIAHRLNGVLRRLTDPSGSNRWLPDRCAILANELRVDLKDAFDFPAGFVAVCIGAGTRNGLSLPLLIGLMGAARVEAVEPEAVAPDDEWRLLHGLSENALRALCGEIGVPGVDGTLASVARFVNVAGLFRESSLAKALAPGLVWRQGTAEALGMRAGSVDLITSRSVMEHVADPAAAYAAMAAALRPGGVLHHDVDFSAHDADRLSFYRKPAAARGAVLDGLNELRLSDHIGILRSLGLLVTVTRVEREPGPIDRSTLQPRFARYDEDDLLTTRAVVVARRPSVAD